MKTAKAAVLSTILLTSIAYNSMKADINSIAASIQNIPGAYKMGSGVDSVSLFMTDNVNNGHGIFPFAILTQSNDTAKTNPFIRAGGLGIYITPNGVGLQASNLGPGIIYWKDVDSTDVVKLLTTGQKPRFDQAPYVKTHMGNQSILINPGLKVPLNKLSMVFADRDSDDVLTYNAFSTDTSKADISTSSDTAYVTLKKAGLVDIVATAKDGNGVSVSDTMHLNILSQPTSVDEQVNNIAKDYELSQNYPNPFNPLTKIAFKLKHDGQARLKIYDIKGQELTTLLDEYCKAGQNVVVGFDASRYASGSYFYRLETPEGVEVKKMTLLK